MSAAFTPPAVGGSSATMSIAVPDFLVADRSLDMTGIGTGTATTTLTPIMVPTEEWSIDGVYWFSVATTPSNARGYLDIEATCGDLVKHAYFGSTGTATPAEAWIELPPGPCTATVAFDGVDGWSGTGDGPVAFVVPSFTQVWLEVSTADGPSSGGLIRGGIPAHIVAHVAGTNGVDPTAGSMTVTDLLTGAVLGSGPIDPATGTFALDTPPLASGVHVFRAEYGGDAGTVGSARSWTQPVDGEPPVGTAHIEGNAVATSFPEARLVLDATDATSSVVAVHLSNDPAVGPGGELASGEAREPSAWLGWPLPGGDGVKHVYVQWRDTVGNWSVPRVVTVILDRAAPSLGAPTGRLAGTGASMSGSRIPVEVSWSASDPASGVARYEVRRSTDGGAWVPVTTTLTRNRFTTQLTPGHAYRFTVRAIDRAGNWAAWVTGPSFRLAGVQQSSSLVRWRGSWTRTSGSAWWGGSARTSTQAGATASVTFTGRSFAWITRLAPARGVAGVYVDGVKVATVDLRAASTRDRRFAWTGRWSTSATRTVTIRVSGTPGRPRVDVDGFAWTR